MASKHMDIIRIIFRLETSFFIPLPSSSSFSSSSSSSVDASYACHEEGKKPNDSTERIHIFILNTYTCTGNRVETVNAHAAFFSTVFLSFFHRPSLTTQTLSVFCSTLISIEKGTTTAQQQTNERRVCITIGQEHCLVSLEDLINYFNVQFNDD
jgi:hypothetical protein